MQTMKSFRPNHLGLSFQCASKKISALRASLLFLHPAPARGGLGAFPEPWIFISDIFSFCTRTREKNDSYIETNHVSGRFFSPTFSHSVFGEHCGLRAGWALSPLMIKSASSTMNFLLHAKCSQLYIPTGKPRPSSARRKEGLARI